MKLITWCLLLLFFKLAEQCKDWDVRLVEGETASIVREVCVNEEWTVLHHSSNGLSRVICRQQGLSIYGIPMQAESLNLEGALRNLMFMLIENDGKTQ